MSFSHRRSVLRPLFRTLHGLLGYQRSSALFRPVCLSSTCLSVFNLSVCLQPVCLSSTCLSVFNLSVCLQPVCLSSTCLSVFYLSVCLPALLLSSTCQSVFDLSVYHLIANPIACASFPHLTHLSCR